MPNLTIAQASPLPLLRANKARNKEVAQMYYGSSDVWFSYYRERVGAPWRAVVNPQGERIAYKSEAFALNGAAIQKPNRFVCLSGRGIAADGDCLGIFSRGSDPAPLAPVAADEFARLIVAALNAYAPAQEWLAARNGHGPLEGAKE